MEELYGNIMEISQQKGLFVQIQQEKKFSYTMTQNLFEEQGF